MPSIVLHQFPVDVGVESGSPFSAKVHRILGLKGLEYTPKDVASPRALQRLNPGVSKVPILEYDGELVTDSSTIAAFLDERHPDPPLWPAEEPSRARARLVEDWADEALYWFAVHRRWAVDANFKEFRGRAFGNLPIPVRWIVPAVVRRQVRSQLRGQGLGRLPEDRVLELLRGHLRMLETLLGAGPFLFGDTVTLADLAVFSPLRAMAVKEASPTAATMVREHAPLVAWLRRVDEATTSPHTVTFDD